ncbi:hypothetical protein GF312_19850 [Candidatus Poribacteria bacterium]|nr:hypothetical protein [Candidatus Poribacteria bacterium]
MSHVISIAHRGASGKDHSPENTLAAFQEAIDIGVDGIECDVHRTADAHIITIHDATLNRTTDMKGDIKALTLDDIKKADAGSWLHTSFRGQRVPTLNEMLELTKGKAVNIIEIKAEGITQEVIKVIEETGAVDECIIISFHPNAIADAFRINPSIPRALLIGGSIAIRRTAPILKLIQQAVELGAGTLNLAYKIISPKLIKEAHKRGIGVWAWTVDDEEEIKRLIDIGIDGITSNYPKMLKTTVDR